MVRVSSVCVRASPGAPLAAGCVGGGCMLRAGRSHLCMVAVVEVHVGEPLERADVVPVGVPLELQHRERALVVAVRQQRLQVRHLELGPSRLALQSALPCHGGQMQRTAPLVAAHDNEASTHTSPVAALLA